MNENRPQDVKLDESQNGTVSFAGDVIATIAGLATTEIEGVASMSTGNGGIADMFSRKNARNFTKGVRIDLDDTGVTVDISIIVEYGHPIPQVCGGIQENVKKAIETMAGLEVKAVNVRVSSMSFENEIKAAKELDEAQKRMLREAEEQAAQQEAEERAREEAASEPAEPVEEPEMPLEEEPEEDAEEVKEALEEEE